jgi:GNAT superfamily N-acetyltransferase
LQKSDAPALAQLITELGYPTQAAKMESRLESILNDPQYRTFVAINDGRVCGMIGTCSFHSHEHNGQGGRILALVVSPKERGRGVGRVLIQAAEEDFAGRNITRIALNTRFQREDAHRFYENLGYSRTGYRFVKELKPERT